MSQVTIEESRYKELLECEAKLNKLTANPSRNAGLVLEAIRQASERDTTPENICIDAEARELFRGIYSGGDRGRQKAWNSGIAQLIATGSIAVKGHVITLS